ncbi:hypothetical protein M413DRAFT_14306 [Hebeloma cylindrosporum]|uniref:Uncharacterized protein n=1 Tax=Hebeloma cylindrosporum TaxID=76867 RepID=A0A0C3BUQ4_HEBCY|nr:hypothetical protein M413DRAFT_14306 [Hebeloma cylindrosporum h7]
MRQRTMVSRTTEDCEDAEDDGDEEGAVGGCEVEEDDGEEGGSVDAALCFEVVCEGEPKGDGECDDEASLGWLFSMKSKKSVCKMDLRWRCNTYEIPGDYQGISGFDLL